MSCLSQTVRAQTLTQLKSPKSNDPAKLFRREIQFNPLSEHSKLSLKSTIKLSIKSSIDTQALCSKIYPVAASHGRLGSRTKKRTNARKERAPNFSIFSKFSISQIAVDNILLRISLWNPGSESNSMFNEENKFKTKQPKYICPPTVRLHRQNLDTKSEAQ